MVIESEDISAEMRRNFPDLCLEQLAEDFNDHLAIVSESVYGSIEELADAMIDSLDEEMQVQFLLGIKMGSKPIQLERIRLVFLCWLQKIELNSGLAVN